MSAWVHVQWKCPCGGHAMIDTTGQAWCPVSGKDNPDCASCPGREDEVQS